MFCIINEFLFSLFINVHFLTFKKDLDLYMINKKKLDQFKTITVLSSIKYKLI